MADSKPPANPRDVFFLMQKYQEFNNNIGSTDICVLFSFWQTHFGSMTPLETNSDEADGRNHDENKTWMNFNSKSFNNKTMFGHEQAHHREDWIEDSCSKVEAFEK